MFLDSGWIVVTGDPSIFLLAPSSGQAGTVTGTGCCSAVPLLCCRDITGDTAGKKNEKSSISVRLIPPEECRWPPVQTAMHISRAVPTLVFTYSKSLTTVWETNCSRKWTASSCAVRQLRQETAVDKNDISSRMRLIQDILNVGQHKINRFAFYFCHTSQKTHLTSWCHHFWLNI